MTVPPPINNQEPRFDLPERELPRVYSGWVILAAIFTLMIAQQMNGYLARGKEPTSKYRQVVAEFQTAVRMKQAAKAIGAPNSGDLDAAVQKVVTAVEKDASTNEIAARIYAAAKNELGKPIPENVLARMKESTEPRDKFFLEVFSAKTLSKERAQQIEKELKGGGFISQLATVVAYEKAGDKSRRDQMVTPAQAFFRFGILAMGMVAVVVGALLWILFITLKGQKRLEVMGFRLSYMSPRDADLLALRCAQVFTVFLGGQVLSMVAIQAMGPNADRPATKLIVYLLLAVCVLALFRFPVGGRTFSLADIGIHKEHLGKNIAWGVAAAMANLPLVFLAATIGQKLFSWLPSPEHPVTSELAAGTGVFETFVIFVAGAVVAPLIEEIMFRGTLAPALAKVMKSPVSAILLQGLLFASIHPTGVPAWLPLATIGAMSGFLYRQTGSLVPSIVMHAVHNFGTLLFAKAIFG